MAVTLSRSASSQRALSVPVLGWLAVGARLDVVLVGALLGMAGAVRWPNLLLSPQFPSVGDTIVEALAMADGRAFPLHDSAPYLGAPFVWLLALAYRLFGPGLQVTMSVALVIGMLTVVPTYLLGKEVGGRLGGIVAAAFLATSGAHTVVTSHVPLSHSLTPLVCTTTIWMLVRATRHAEMSLAQGGRYLAFAGLLAGLTLQTHPTSAPLLVGSALGAVLMRPGWLRTRWPAIAVVLVVVGYSTLLIYHITSRFEIVGDIQEKQERYLDADVDAGESSTHGVYVNNLEQLVLSTARLVSGALDEREEPRDFWTDPWVSVTAGLALLGVMSGTWRRQWWLVSGVLLAVLLPPAFSGKYRPILDGRYLMPLVPVLFVAGGLAVSAIVRVIATSGAAAPTPGGRPASGTAHAAALGRALAVLALLGVTVLLVVHPLTFLSEFYKSSQEDGFSNATYFRTMALIRGARQPGEAVLLDPLLNNVKSTGGGKASSSFDFLLALERIPTQPLESAGQPRELTGRLAILSRATADRLDDALQLEALDGKHLTGRNSPSYRAYRIGGAATAQR